VWLRYLPFYTPVPGFLLQSHASVMWLQQRRGSLGKKASFSFRQCVCRYYISSKFAFRLPGFFLRVNSDCAQNWVIDKSLERTPNGKFVDWFPVIFNLKIIQCVAGDLSPEYQQKVIWLSEIRQTTISNTWLSPQENNDLDMVTPEHRKMSHILGLHISVEKECLAPRSPLSVDKLMNIKG